MKPHQSERIALLLFFTACLLLFMWLSLFKGCGFSKPRKVIVEQGVDIPVAKLPECDGAGGKPTRNLLCPPNFDGIIVEVCDEDANWRVVANSCQERTAEVPDPAPVLNLDHVETVALTQVNQLLSQLDREQVLFINTMHAPNKAEAYAALNRALNSASFEQAIELCKPIDEFESVCALNHDELGLDSNEVRLLIANLEKPFESKTTKGKVLAQLTGKPISIIHYDDLINTLIGNAVVYNRIMGFETADLAFASFGVNVANSIAGVDYSCIGTNESGISAAKNTRLICIFEGSFAGRDSVCHVSFDNPALAGADRDLFQSPFIDPARSQKLFKAEASEAICTLPNGLHGYFLFNAAGAIQAFAPENIVFCNNQNCIDGTISTPSDCMNCHQDGLIPKHDVIKAHVISSGAFNADEVELAKAIYLDDGVANQVFARDNKAFETAVNATGGKFDEPNHLILGFNKYLRLQGVAEVAAYLMVSEKELLDCIEASNLISGQIGTLSTGGRITEETFSAAFQDILRECKFNVDPLVRPL